MFSKNGICSLNSRAMNNGITEKTFTEFYIFSSIVSYTRILHIPNVHYRSRIHFPPVKLWNEFLMFPKTLSLSPVVSHSSIAWKFLEWFQLKSKVEELETLQWGLQLTLIQTIRHPNRLPKKPPRFPPATWKASTQHEVEKRYGKPKPEPSSQWKMKTKHFSFIVILFDIKFIRVYVSSPPEHFPPSPSSIKHVNFHSNSRLHFHITWRRLFVELNHCTCIYLCYIIYLLEHAFGWVGNWALLPLADAGEWGWDFEMSGVWGIFWNKLRTYF